MQIVVDSRESGVVSRSRQSQSAAPVVSQSTVLQPRPTAQPLPTTDSRLRLRTADFTTVDYRIATTFVGVRYNSVPSEIAGVARIASVMSLSASTSNVGPAFSTNTCPSSLAR
jgi:hypothetical protein